MIYSKTQEFIKQFAENKIAVVCLIITGIFVFIAIFAPLISPTNPYDLKSLQLSDSLKPTGTKQIKPGAEYRIGLKNDSQGPIFENGQDAAAIELFEVSSCGNGCIQFGAKDKTSRIESLEIRDLPSGSVIDGAKKHPIRPWYTLKNPANSVITMTNEGGFNSDFKFTAIAKTTGSETGLTFYLGTDGFGRDMLSSILYGVRISIFVGLMAASLAMIIGTTLGLISAWCGGAVDAFIMRAVDFMLGFPSILVGLVVLAVLGSGIDKIIFAVVIVQWAYYARTTRSVALVELRKEYVEAAHCQRFSPIRIMVRHVLPNCTAPLIVLFTLNIASAISLEASLSFLGMGLPLTEPSLGMLISNGYEFIFSNKYWVSIYPGIVLLIMIISMNLLGDRLRDVTNPRLNN